MRRNEDGADSESPLFREADNAQYVDELSGMGKTMIMERFRDDNPPGFDPGTGRERTPVLAMEMVGKPGERRFYAELLALLGAPQSPRADIVQMEQGVLRLLKAVGVQVLLIDEVHNILAGSHRDQRVVLNTLRFLSNRLQISLVCFGVTDAREAISGDVQQGASKNSRLAVGWRTSTLKPWCPPSCAIPLCASRPY